MTLKIELHLLQNFAPSCLNRDDTNTPKTCEFGGATRARVSSQSWKRAVRETFREDNAAPVAIRTKHLHERLKEKLGMEVEAVKITKFLEECYSKMDKNPERTDQTAVLVFISDAEVDEAAACLREGVSGKDAVNRLRRIAQSADIGLFGRMLAEQPELKIDAACQVAHAISTHQADYETDFYTAVDDLTQDKDETGAGMLGTQGFNAACFYRYALVDHAQLVKNMGGDTRAANAALEAFLRAFTLSIPNAKQNSHAAQNLPSFGLLVARETGTPISLANAFARPVRADDLIGASIHALARHHAEIGRVYGLYDGATQAAFLNHMGDKPLGELAPFEVDTFAQAVNAVMERVDPTRKGAA